jgi:hypothetical protein
LKAINTISGKRLFLEIVVLPYLCAFLLLFSSIAISNNSITNQKILFSIIVFIIIFPYLYWLIKINKLIKTNSTNEQKYIISLVYMLVYIIFCPFVLQTYQGTETIKIILIFHFLMMIASAYVIFHISKNLCMYETKKEVGIIDYAGTFILLSLYPIGLFSIQKRLRNI